MNDIIKQIEAIRKHNKENKLVIFVGAGVSRNSGVCSWWELVKEMALKINYNDICDKCEMKSLTCSECGENLQLCSFDNYNCQYRYNFSSDEFLKIPQYFYEEKGEEEYIEFLKEKFCNDYETNAIDDLIVKLSPEHIITTNYDHLIECVKDTNLSGYTVVKRDKDLLSKYGNHYIIKMHGDIDDFNKNELKNIVLKEDDYLKYSQTHEIIESYIKSLLFDKTFLFVGYSLNDNNLKLIMSYIDYYVKNQGIENRMHHYLVTNGFMNKEREAKYWINKSVELIDLSNITEFMMRKAPKKLENQGKRLFSFLMYLNEIQPFAADETEEIKNSLLNKINQFDFFNAISYNALLSAYNFEHTPLLEGNVLNIFDEKDYNNFYNIFSSNDEVSCKIKEYFIKSRINCICNFHSKNKEHYKLNFQNVVTDEMLEQSILWDYTELEKKLLSMQDSLEKAYYFSLLYKKKKNLCYELLLKIESDFNKKDFLVLNLQDKYQMSILQFNLISIRLLNNQTDNKEQQNKLNKLLDSASNQCLAFEYIKSIRDDNGETLNKLHSILLKHEEYYTKKSTMTKYGRTIYGDLLELQAIVYDYYLFYKKNFLMLDWFNNVSKMCEPYIKAILCTYYPDEYQYSRTNLGRTQVKKYPLNITDIDMIIRHVKFKDFKSWIANYKVFQIILSKDLDIAKIFDNFCTSIKKYWQNEYADYVNNFGLLLSLLEFSENEYHIIFNSYIKLVTPDKNSSIKMLRNCLRTLRLFLNKHYHAEDKLNYKLLDLLINEFLLTDPLDMQNDYINLIRILSGCADEKIYKKCCNIIANCSPNRKKAYYPYVFIDILLKFDEKKWKLWIKENISKNWVEEIAFYLEKKIIPFDDDISKEIETQLEEMKYPKGIYTYPNNKAELINTMVILILLEIIPNLNEVEYLKKYCSESEYLDFLFNPETFDYSKINIADYMWCNIINSPNYRNVILKHKSDFWNKDQEKRIKLGFGGNFENMIAYKYLFD